MSKGNKVLIALVLAIPIIAVLAVGLSIGLLVLGFESGLPYTILLSMLAIFRILQEITCCGWEETCYGQLGQRLCDECPYP